MLNEPFFQKDILAHIIKYMSFYLGFENWFTIFVCCMLFIYGCYKIVTYKTTVCYDCVFPSEKYFFSLKDKQAVLAFIFLAFCIAFNIFAFFNQEMSFFCNYDTRGNVIPILERGVVPAWGSNARFFPLGFWDTNILYAITHHFSVISVYLSIQSLIIVLLLNYFLRFIPVWKRFLCIGLIMISPAVFSISSIVFPEKLLLMYIIGSLICMQKYAESPEKKYFLWLTILLINFALYAKELSILFYFGIFMYYAVGHLIQGRVVPSSFLHPIKTARAYPFEVLLFLSLLIYVALYGAYMPSIRYSYISNKVLTLSAFFKVYYTEIIISVILFYFMVRNLFLKKKYMFMEGMSLGAVLIAFELTFILKIAHTVPSMAYKSYYMIIPYLVGMIYIFWRIKNKYVLVFICSVFFISSLIRDYVIYSNEDGYSYREVADSIMSKNKNSKVNIFMANHLEYELGWFTRSWTKPYRYYWPNNQITFYSAEINGQDMFFYHEENIFYKDKPDHGDYFVARKGEYHPEALKQIPREGAEKIFENDRFEVYIIK